jgi:hypothetical protein
MNSAGGVRPSRPGKHREAFLALGNSSAACVAHTSSSTPCSSAKNVQPFDELIGRLRRPLTHDAKGAFLRES